MRGGPLLVGAKAPAFDVEADDGVRYALSASLERGPVVLFFYPGNNTPG